MQARGPVPDTADVLVIGGGINGISTFRELALQGVRVVLIDRDDFCAGASAALSRMVHGGLRYLENGEFGLVRESLVERDRLLRNAPHVVFPLPTVVPITTWLSGSLGTITGFFGAPRRAGARPGVMIRIGLLLYDVLSRRSRRMPRHRALSRAELKAILPGVTDGAVGGVLYYDARVSLPERLGVEMILDTEAETSSRAFNYVELSGRDGDALVWRDRLTGATGHIRPKLVVNATGAWVDEVEQLLRPGRNRARVQGTKGSHLVIRNEALQAALGDRMLYYEHDDGRICIAFNHLGVALVGSTDIRVDDPDEADCTEAEQAYMLGALARVLPGVAIDTDDIVHVFTGVRPLPLSDAGATGRISRDHSVEEDDEPGSWPVLTLVGGKWTTFRAFGAEVADAALRRLGSARTVQTEDRRIGGGRDFPDEAELAAWIDEKTKETGLPRERFATLAARYGSRAIDAAGAMTAGPDAPLDSAPDYSRREIAWVTEREHVRDLSDVVLRRTSLGIEGRIDAAVIAEVAGIVGRTLGWTEGERKAAIARTEDIIARRHRVRPNGK